jgi:nucleoside 2-deoxyribosyltransferase
MNIYISVSISVCNESKDALRNLAKELKARGHKINDYRLSEDFQYKVQYSDKEMGEYYKNMMNAIKQCDVMIVDISSRSSGVGYEIGVAITEKKPILAVYSGSKEAHSSLSLASNPSKYLSVKNYTSDKSLLSLSEAFIKDAQQKIDTKFILIISPQIDKYLEWAASERRMHKAQVVREALEAQMNKDKEYQAFLKDMEKGN